MKFQAPKGTRDFYPQQMAWRRWLENQWRTVSIRNGFEEVEGPIFESLDLYKLKSGEGIVSELFHFTDRGERELAIRPEFTPTLARMVAAKAASLPRPIKWFSIPNLCRAERPQRGRTREFIQWNIDMLGDDTPVADAECIFTCVDLLQTLGLTPRQVKIKISHRDTVRLILLKLGVPDDKILDAFDLLDRREKMAVEQFRAEAAKLGLDVHSVERFEQMCRRKYSSGDVAHLERSIGGKPIGDLEALDEQLRAFGIAEWCEYDLGIVRGLAYYTGTVFEVHEVSGTERAMGGGGRYDKLIELSGGPPMPAVGFGMGDVVLSLVLEDKGLAPKPTDIAPKVDAYVIAATDTGATKLHATVAGLRRVGRHVRFSYKASRNVGKLLKDASSANARFAVILDDKAAEGQCDLKDMASGEQTTISLKELAGRLT